MNLVTGATGHIGNVLVRMLLEKGEKVRVLILPGEDNTPLDGLQVERMEGNVLDFQSLVSAFKGIGVVYHLAGVISIMPGRNPLVQMVNVIGTRNVIQAARQTSVQRLVYTSSIHALQRVPHGITIDESIPFDPIHAISSYDYSKAAASLEVLQAVNQGLDAVIACPTGVIGPFDFQRSQMGQLILDCVEQKPFLYVDGAYDFVDVRDVAHGLILVGEKGCNGESYILSGERISVIEVMKTVQRIIGKRIPHIRIPLNLALFFSHFTPLYYQFTHHIPRLTPYSLATIASNSDISHAKARRELGYTPRPLYESLSDTVKWFLQHRASTYHPK